MALKSTIQQFIPIMEINRDRPTLVKQNNKILLNVLSNEKREIYPITVHYYERSLLTSLLNRKRYECHNCCQRNIPCNEIRHSLLKIYEIVSEKAQYIHKTLLIEHVQYYKYYVRKF